VIVLFQPGYSAESQKIFNGLSEKWQLPNLLQGITLKINSNPMSSSCNLPAL